MLRELVTDLRRLPPLDRAEAEMGRTLSLAAAASQLSPPLPQRPGEYTRTCVYADKRFEVLLLDWSPGSATPIHDHGGEHWFVVLKGRLRVDDFARTDACDVPGRALLAQGESRELSPGGLDLRSGPHDIHRVTADDRAVTPHVYARPLQSFLVYDREAHRCRPASGGYDWRLPLFAGAGAG